MDGCYVLAVACKELPADTTTEQIMAMQREDVESASTLEVNSARQSSCYSDDVCVSCISFNHCCYSGMSSKRTQQMQL